MSFDPRVIKQSIENLKLLHPSLMEDEEAWTATLESETSFDDLLTSIARRKRFTEGLVVGAKFELDEIKMRKDRLEHRIEAMRELAFKIMQAAELNKRELAIATFSIRKGQQKVIGEPDPLTLPAKFQNVKITPNLTAIKDALAAGETVPGCALSNAEPNISIRIK